MTQIGNTITVVFALALLLSCPRDAAAQGNTAATGFLGQLATGAPNATAGVSSDTTVR